MLDLKQRSIGQLRLSPALRLEVLRKDPGQGCWSVVATPPETVTLRLEKEGRGMAAAADA